MILLSRDDLERGLQLVVAELRDRGMSANVRIVGGAALALRYYDRESTYDIDIAVNLSESDLAEVAEAVAAEQGWSADWLNSAAAKFVPSYGRSVDWVTIHDEHGIVIQIAPPEALLAMKLRANRPGRDDYDIKVLMAICSLSTVDELEELFGEFYPADMLSERALKIIATIQAEGIGEPPPAPAPIRF